MTAKLNGNQFVKETHVFVPEGEGRGCYFPSMQKALDHGTSPNGTGLWIKTLEYGGQTWYQAGNENVFD